MKTTEPDLVNPDRHTGQAYVLFAVSMILVVTIGTIVQAVSGLVGLVITEIVLILLPAVLFVRSKGLPIAAALGWRPVKPSIVWMSIAVGVAAWGVAAGIHELSRLILGDPPKVAAFEAQSVPQLLWVLFCAALMPGICEETLFRGAIQGILGRRGTRRAIVITALLFAVYHVNPWILVPAFFLGVVFGIMAARTGSSIPAILAHLSNNATSFTVAYLYRNRPDAEAYLLVAVLAVGFLVLFPVVLNRIRGDQVAPSILATVPAGVSRPVVWIAGVLAGGFVLSIVAIAGLIIALVDVLTMPSDAFKPEIQRGDQLVMLQSGFLRLDLEVGDIVSIRRDGETILRTVSRVEEDTVWVVDGFSELELSRDEIAAKLVHSFNTATE